MASDCGVIRGEDESGKQDWRPQIPPPTDFLITRYGEEEDRAAAAHGEDERRASADVNLGDEDGTLLEVTDGEPDDDTAGGRGTVDPSGCNKLSSDEEDEENAGCVADNPPPRDDDSVTPMAVLRASSHRDGSIFRGSDTVTWKKDYKITNRNETRLEAMMLSDPADCHIRRGSCIVHTTSRMLQIFSLKLAKLYVEGASVELYGYIAVRDELDPLLNYVVNVSRDDPIIVEQGSFISMAGPKRGIDILGTILLEYDMRIKTGEQEQDDLQLIDGVGLMDDIDTGNCLALTRRIYGGDHGGAVDITASRLDAAVEATVDILVSEVASSFDLRLGCFVSDMPEEISIFDGHVSEPRRLKRTVVAVVRDTWMDLKFRVGAGAAAGSSSSTTTPDDDDEHCFSFKANKHGRAVQERRVTGFAVISAKVTWSTLPRGF